MNAFRGSFIGALGSEIVRVVYSDESGTGDGTQPITVVTALLLNADSQWSPVERELKAIKAHIPQKLLRGERGTPSPYMKEHRQEFEFKGSLLFKGIRGKRHGIDQSEAIKALVEILNVVVRNKILIFHGAIDRAGRANFNRNTGFDLNLQTDEEVAFTECLERLDAYVHTFLPQERVLWIADKSGYEASVKHSLNFFQTIKGMDAPRVRDLVSQLRSEFTNGVFDGVKVRDDDGEAVSHVIDTIYFGHSHESLALQLADICCSVVAEYLLQKDDTTPFYNRIRRQILTDNTPIVFSEAWGGKTCK
jgi:hypothetical protein